MAFSVPDTMKLNKPILLALDASSSSAVHEVGYRVSSTDGKEFVFTYMQCAAVATYEGSPAVWVDTTADYVVTPDCSAGAVAAVGATGGPAGGASGFAGVFCMNNTDSNNVYLWVQTRGLVDYACVSTDVAVNDVLLISADDCFVDAQSYASSLTDVFILPVGHALTAAAAHGTATGDQTTHSVASIMLL